MLHAPKLNFGYTRDVVARELQINFLPPGLLSGASRCTEALYMCASNRIATSFTSFSAVCNFVATDSLRDNATLRWWSPNTLCSTRTRIIRERKVVASLCSRRVSFLLLCRRCLLFARREAKEPEEPPRVSPCLQMPSLRCGWSLAVNQSEDLRHAKEQAKWALCKLRAWNKTLGRSFHRVT